MKSVFAYTRVSTARQGTHGSSLVEQKSAIERYAQQQNLTIIEWFEERETAAKRGRPVFMRMLKLLVGNKATGVIIHKIDRSARNLRDWADLGELVDRGVEIHLAHESLDLKSRGGRLAADIQAVVAADYVRNLRDEVRKGMLGRLKQGLFPLPAPVGYLNQGGGKPKIIDPETAPLIRRIFELYATGSYTLDTLQIEARKLGLKNRKGGALARSSLSDLLTCEFYTGVIRIKSRSERFTGVHEPIISPDLFREVQAVRQGRKIKSGLKNDLAYRKLVRCDHCARFVAGEVQKGYVYYRCHSKICRGVSIREEALETQIRTWLATITLPSEAIPLIKAEVALLGQQASAGHADIVATVQLQLGQLDAKLARLTDAYLEGVIDKANYADRQFLLMQEKASKRETLTELQRPAGVESAKAKRAFELQNRLQQAKDSINQAELADMMKSVCSNWRMDGKNLLFEPEKGLREVAEFNVVWSGGPQRTTLRTKSNAVQRIERMATESKAAIAAIAKAILAG